MIVRGIVSETEVEQIKAAAAQHGLTLNKPGSFQTWTEDGAIWVEVDVHEDVFSYLNHSGFFDGSEEAQSNRKEELK